MATMTDESDLQSRVIDRCDKLGLLWFHSFDPRRDRMAGWPDLVIVGHGILYRELKSDRGTVSAEQSRFGRAIRAAGGNWDVWRESDWESGRIQRELRILASCPMDASADVPLALLLAR